MIKKLLLFCLIFVSFSLVFSHPQKTYAACNEAASCDAPPGTCGPTCNGGKQCVINQGTVTRTCDNTVTQQCVWPSQDDIDNGADPYTAICSSQNISGCEGQSGSTVVTTCVDVVWATCCSPGTPAACGDDSCDAGESVSCPSDCGVAIWCGDGTCNGSEDTDSCATDCPGAAAPPPASCGDGSCNNGELCSTCSSDCGACAYCGDSSCNNGETCSSCATDCGSCAGSFCGDFSCDAFETCSTCASDCGACSSNEAWFQVSGGQLGSENDGGASLALQSNITGDELCVSPTCIRSLLRSDLANTNLTDGFAIVGDGTIEANGLISERSPNTYASNTKKTRYQEKYEFFYRNSGLGLTPSNTFTGSENDALKPTYNASNIAYYQSGDLTIQSAWDVTAGETYVIFVDGNLTLTDGDGASDQLINVADGGFLAFIVSGNIIIEESLGNATLTSTTANLEGVFIANGTITTESRGSASGGDDRFIGEGVFAGWGGVSLDRDFTDGAGRSVENNDKAAELFVYRPDFLENMPDIMLIPIRIWQETN